ncbi:heme-thiolate peroxidase aromatic peroxygenase like protein [Teratosphaeria destructans]|uniref:Heme-thiolate peroxidase aromatic peroxygenase like protein n=1 Tax=Teratosphaeria destructans TaxID=418781 RepID=A0A9W7SN72_9PEZI|nr:heme-thiolate peroxidase aromatic peroxygenase like protein [Teratosphaeria destructans]
MRSFDTLTVCGLLPVIALAYPWALDIANGGTGQGVSKALSSQLTKRASAGVCPIHATRQGAAPYSDIYPSKYTGAKDGLPGTGKGGVLVPAEGDTAHAYQAPSSTDLRGPCPGLNTLANHHFISHDGLTTYTEMVDAAQNVYNWEWDLAAFVATTGVVQDGDPVTGDMSIGCTGGLSTSDTGLQTHNKFEVDASLARTDYALSPTGDAYTVNGSLFGQMIDTCSDEGFSLPCMAKYDQQRFNESLTTNGQFFNGPFTFFVLGTSLLPLDSFANFKSGTANPTVADMAAFWGVSQTGDSWTYNRNETLPPDWYNRPEALSLPFIADQVFTQYGLYPTPLGATRAPPTLSAVGGLCLLYQTIAIGVPTALLQMVAQDVAAANFVETKLAATFAAYGCKT